MDAASDWRDRHLLPLPGRKPVVIHIAPLQESTVYPSRYRDCVRVVGIVIGFRFQTLLQRTDEDSHRRKIIIRHPDDVNSRTRLC